MVALADAVRLARIDDELDRHIVGAQRTVEPYRLVERDALVLLTVQDQHGRARRARMVDRAELDRTALLRSVPRRTTADLALEARQVAGHDHRAPVADPRAHDGRLEATRLRHGPGRHEAALTPAADPQARGVGDPALDRGIDHAHDVAVVGPAHIAPRGRRKRFPM